MEFMYNYAGLPKDCDLLMNINSAANRLFNKLRDFNIEAQNISEYNKNYFRIKLKSLKSVLQLNCYILSWAMAKSNVPLSGFVFLEYGGGSGMLSLLAKELNIGIVIYNDIYDVSCADARVIGEGLGNQADYYVHGDIDDVIRFSKNNSIFCNAIASYDVIEHIYDIEGFLSKLHLLSDGPLTVVMSSGANNSNPLTRKHLMKKQLEVEYEDRGKKCGHKERDSLRAYLKIREEIIQKYAGKLKENEVKQLARATRGMIEFDIKRCVDTYQKTRQWPKEPSHSTNTCDPYTGNWMEHLMDPYHLKDILSKEGFEVEILSGYYGHSKSMGKRVLGNLLNMAIYFLGRQRLLIAPFFTLYGNK